MSLHIGILQTDSVLEHLQPVHGDYPNMFMDLFLEQDRTLGSPIMLSKRPCQRRLSVMSILLPAVA